MEDSTFKPLGRSVQDWQPIETAPKDGTPVLVTCEYMGHRQFSVAWNEGDGWSGGASAIPNLYWTAWMPLPPAPTSDDRSVGAEATWKAGEEAHLARGAT